MWHGARSISWSQILAYNVDPWSQNFDILIHDPKIIFWSQMELLAFTVDLDPDAPDHMGWDSRSDPNSVIPDLTYHVMNL